MQPKITQSRVPRKFRNQVNYSRYGYIFVAPFIIAFLVFTLYSTIFTFRLSVLSLPSEVREKRPLAIDEAVYTGLDNFRDLLGLTTAKEARATTETLQDLLGLDTVSQIASDSDYRTYSNAARENQSAVVKLDEQAAMDILKTIDPQTASETQGASGALTAIADQAVSDIKAAQSAQALSSGFWTSIGNTSIMWIINFIPQVFFALLLANWFTDTRLRLRFQGGFKVLIFMPNIITAATVAMLFNAIFGYPTAPINALLQQLGLINAPIEFFRSTEFSRGLISFLQWWMWYGYTMIILIAGILGINPDLFEAGLVDGCNSRQMFRKITLPLLRPIMLYMLVTSLIGGLQMFDIPQLMTQGNPNGTTNTVARYIYMQAMEGDRNFYHASAASIILFLIIVVISLMLFFFMRERVPRKLRRASK